MKVLNNRYELFEVLEEQYNWVKYRIKDRFNREKLYSLKLYNTSYNEILINFFVREYLASLKQLKHPAFVPFFDFDIIEYINGSKIDRPIYFSVCGYYQTPQTELEEYAKEEMIDFFLASIYNFVDFLIYGYHRGLNTEMIELDDLIFIIEKECIEVRLIDPVSILEAHFSDMKDTLHSHEMADYFFGAKNIIPPDEVFHILTSLLSPFRKLEKVQKIQRQLERLKEKTRIQGINPPESLLFLKNVKEILSEPMENNDAKGKLYRDEQIETNLYGKMIGRRLNYDYVVNCFKKFESRLYAPKLIIIRGEEGVGRTRFLKELDFYAKMMGSPRFFFSGDVKQTSGNLLEKLFVTLTKEANPKLIEKYGEELVKIAPNLQETGIKPSVSLSEAKEKLRLFRRLIQFLNEISQEKPVYFFIDDFDKSDEQFLDFLNFCLGMPGKNTFLFVLSETKYGQHKTVSENLFSNNKEELDVVELLRLNINEIGELIQNVLNVRTVPISYVAKMFKLVGGIPALIEQVLVKQIHNGEITKVEGQYNFERSDFNNVILQSTSEHFLNDIIKDLTEDEQTVLKCMALFHKMISLEIIEKVFEDRMSEIMLTLMQLVEKGVFQVQLDDTGYTYAFADTKLKSLLLNLISSEEKKKMHGNIVSALEYYYDQKEERLLKGLPLYEEMLVHYVGLGDMQKAIAKMVEFAKEVDEKYGEFQSVYLWERAYSLLDDISSELDMEVHLQLAKAYDFIGKTNQAVNLYEDIIQKSEIHFEIACLARMYYVKILIQKEEIQKAEEHIAFVQRYQDFIENKEVIFLLIQHQNNLFLKSKKYEEVLLLTADYLEEAERIQEYHYVGIYYNQIGLSLLYMGQIQSAESYLLRSYDALKKLKNVFTLAKPLNNLGLIYAEYYFDFEKALQYYEEALRYSRETSRTVTTSILLINMGQIHIVKGELKKAEGLFLEAIKLSKELEDWERVFAAELNLAIIYMRTGRYRECFRYIQKFSTLDESTLNGREDIFRYQAFMVEFAYYMDDFDLLEKYQKQLESEHTDFYRYFVYASRMWKVLLYYYLPKDVESSKKEVFDFLEHIIKTPYTELIRTFLLRASYISLVKRDFQIYKTCMDLDAQYEDKFQTPFLKHLKKLLQAMYHENLEQLEELKKEKEVESYFDLTHYILYQLSERNFDQGNFYSALNGYLKCLYHALRNANGIESEYYRKGLLYGYHVDKVFIKIQEIKKQLDSTYEPLEINDFLQLKDLESLYKHLNLSTLFENEAFVATIPRKSCCLCDVDNLGDLITRLTEDSEENIKLLRNFVLEKVYGDRCVVMSLNQEDDDYGDLLQSEDWVSEYKFSDFVPMLQENDIGFIVKRGLFSESMTDRLLKNTAMAGMFVPIYKATHITHNNTSDRRNNRKKFHEEMIGFIFIESQDILNNFSPQNLELSHVISHLLYNEVRNYQLRNTSYIDKLTHVYTRKYFEREFNKIFMRYSQINEPFSVIMADIDKFKNINDTYGHQTGDTVLAMVSKIIKENVRGSDIVGRYGGEEFVVILPDCSPEEAFGVAEKIRRTIEETVVIGNSYSITISQGISSFPEHSQIKEELIPKADQAMYYAKDNGRNQTFVWNKSLAMTNSRMDKLEGIVTGNIVQDQRMALVVMEIAETITEKQEIGDKVYLILGRLLEYIEAWQGGMAFLDDSGVLSQKYYRERQVDGWIKKVSINENNFKQVIASKRGQYLIDWDSVSDIDMESGQPNWQSVVITPMIKDSMVKGVMFFNVSAKKQEFDYKTLNFLELISRILTGIL